MNRSNYPETVWPCAAVAVLTGVIGLGMVTGCATSLPKAPPQPMVQALAPPTAGVLSDVAAATRARLGKS